MRVGELHPFAQNGKLNKAELLVPLCLTSEPSALQSVELEEEPGKVFCSRVGNISELRGWFWVQIPDPVVET